MKNSLLIFVIAAIAKVSYCQVGIGTTTPSTASMLEVSATSDGGITYKGLMPPRVPDVNARDAINPNVSDTGLMVFVQSINCLQIWNGVVWENIYCIAANISFAAVQDFDLNTSWSYNVAPPFYNVGTDIWDIVSSLPNITNVSGNFLGCRDLENPNGGGNFFHEIQFNNVNVSALTNARVAFDYDIYRFDNGDDVRYEVFFDNVGQGIVTFINGSGDYSEAGTIVINVPMGVTDVRLTLGINQNGDLDYAGFDKFMVYGQ